MRFLFLVLSLLCLATPACADGKELSGSAPATKDAGSAAVSMDKPSMDTQEVLSWAAEAASDAMTFSYTDYQRRLQQSSRRFTKTGWETFAAALQRSQIIDSITAQSQTVSAKPKERATLQEKGPVEGKYRWVVSLPLVVSFKGAQSSREDILRLRLVIERVSVPDKPNAIGIAEWKAQ